MPLSRVIATGDGVTIQFAISFALGYLNESDITCRVGTEVDGGGAPVYRTLTFINPGLVQVGGAVPGNLVRIEFTRTVTNAALLVDFANGAVLNNANLSVSQKQMIMLVQQVIDGRFAAFTQDLDMGGFKVTNIADPVNAQDAVTQAWVLSHVAPIAGAVLSVNGLGGIVVLTATNIGLGNVNNTSDANKPVSTAQATAIALKAALVHTHVATDITDSTLVGRNLLKAVNLDAQKAILYSPQEFDFSTQARIMAASYNII